MSEAAKARLALSAFFKIAEAWSLSEDNQAAILGLRDWQVLRAWKNAEGPEVSNDTLMRISYILGIYQAIITLLPRKNVAAAWIREPNDAPIFENRSALELLTDGSIDKLKVVRQYLDAEANPLASPTSASSMKFP